MSDLLTEFLNSASSFDLYTYDEYGGEFWEFMPISRYTESLFGWAEFEKDNAPSLVLIKMKAVAALWCSESVIDTTEVSIGDLLEHSNSEEALLAFWMAEKQVVEISGSDFSFIGTLLRANGGVTECNVWNPDEFAFDTIISLPSDSIVSIHALTDRCLGAARLIDSLR